jgi:hypothetical protein
MLLLILKSSTVFAQRFYPYMYKNQYKAVSRILYTGQGIGVIVISGCNNTILCTLRFNQ